MHLVPLLTLVFVSLSTFIAAVPISVLENAGAAVERDLIDVVEDQVEDLDRRARAPSPKPAAKAASPKPVAKSAPKRSPKPKPIAKPPGRTSGRPNTPGLRAPAAAAKPVAKPAAKTAAGARKAAVRSAQRPTTPKYNAAKPIAKAVPPPRRPMSPKAAKSPKSGSAAPRTGAVKPKSVANQRPNQNRASKPVRKAVQSGAKSATNQRSLKLSDAAKARSGTKAKSPVAPGRQPKIAVRKPGSLGTVAKGSNGRALPSLKAPTLSPKPKAPPKLPKVASRGPKSLGATRSVARVAGPVLKTALRSKTGLVGTLLNVVKRPRLPTVPRPIVQRPGLVTSGLGAGRIGNLALAGRPFTSTTPASLARPPNPPKPPSNPPKRPTIPPKPPHPRKTRAEVIKAAGDVYTNRLKYQETGNKVQAPGPLRGWNKADKKEARKAMRKANKATAKTQNLPGPKDEFRLGTEPNVVTGKDVRTAVFRYHLHKEPQGRVRTNPPTSKKGKFQPKPFQNRPDPNAPGGRPLPNTPQAGTPQGKGGAPVKLNEFPSVDKTGGYDGWNNFQGGPGKYRVIVKEGSAGSPAKFEGVVGHPAGDNSAHHQLTHTPVP